MGSACAISAVAGTIIRNDIVIPAKRCEAAREPGPIVPLVKWVPSAARHCMPRRARDDREHYICS
jgi:hypothetical protein